MQESDQLVHTKIRLPITRPGLVPRPRLQERILQGLRGPLTLVIAPAGFGKTTLVASCVTACGMPAAWLSLDKNENQIWHFLSYVVSALREADKTIGKDAVQRMASPGDAAPEAILTGLINDLDTAGRDIVLVLDDYQSISSPAVHEAVTFLLDHCPNPFHLLIVSRSDPPLSLPRLRGRGQVVELRAVDLSFTEPETARFLNDTMGLGLDAGSVSALNERTEGWIAGLQMAALSLRNREDVHGFLEGFSGTNRYILDYLLEEVLAGQPADIQHFLLYTSILDRLTAPLCEALLEVETQDPSAETSRALDPRDCQAVLDYLDRASLFLMPLDEDRRWYRYHQLFADLLRARLDEICPGLSPQLHRRAAAWYEQKGSVLEAIHHASMASDDGTVERLIEENYFEIMNRGEMSAVRYWTGQLSSELVARRPWLCLYEAMNRSWFGQLEEADALLNKAEERIRSAAPEPDTQAMLGYHAYVKSRVTAMRGDLPRAIELALLARGYVPAENVGLHIDFSITLGYEYFLHGDFEDASQTLDEMIRLGSSSGAVNNPVAGYCLLARAQAYRGRLHEADALLQKAMQLIHEPTGQYLGVLGLVEVEAAALLCEWNDVKAALVRLESGLDHLPWWGKTDDFCLAYVILSRIHLALGNAAAAADAVEKAARLTETCGVFSEARSAVEAARVRAWLARGDWPPIRRWVSTFEQRPGSYDPFRYEDELAHITRARVMIAQHRLDEALSLLSGLEGSARAAGRHGRLIQVLILKALAMQASGHAAQAEPAVTESLSLAEPSGCVRVFLDEGKPLQALLRQWLAAADSSPLREYAARLLSAFDAEPHPVTAAREKGGLVEPLSPRELEVLGLIALGRTNREIARQLIVSRGTVKAHTASIYRKLDAANRTEAAARARQLGILHEPPIDRISE